MREITKAEAIHLLNNLIESAFLDSYDKQALSIACDSIERQMPKAPLHILLNSEYSIAAGVCPCCDSYTSSKMKFCSQCGQALDWGEKQ